MELKILTYSYSPYVEDEFNDWIKNNPNISIEKIKCTESDGQYTLWIFYSKK